MTNRFTTAIVRRPCEAFGDGLSTAALGAPDYARMCEQHRAYVAALTGAGVRVTVLDPLPECPDAHFVEDAAVILPELVVATHPGAPARRPEVAPMVDALLTHRVAVDEARAGHGEARPLARIEAPGTLDGGDVLVMGRRAFVGLSTRTNAEGARQLAAHVAPYGYSTHPIPIQTGLHLKAAVNAIADDAIIGWADVVSRREFDAYDRVVVEARDAYAANCLRVNDVVLAPIAYPRVGEALARRGLTVRALDTSESERMDGGLTCLSLRF